MCVPPAGASDVGARALALFDLDGTLTRRDTLVSYLTGFLARHPLRCLRLPRALPAAARFALHRDRSELKSAFIRAALGGESRGALAAWTAQFVAHLARHGMFVDASAALEKHRRHGDTLALLSASPDLYVPAIACTLGFAEVLCTGVEWHGDRLVGRLTTPNRRGAEKVRCLAMLRERYPAAPVVAYGNTFSDLAHLRLADRGVLVNGSQRARQAAAQYGIACVMWQ